MLCVISKTNKNSEIFLAATKKNIFQMPYGGGFGKLGNDNRNKVVYFDEPHILSQPEQPKHHFENLCEVHGITMLHLAIESK